MTERVQKQLKALPAKPGVYLFRDARGQVLYVGKAKSLRPRVRSYFQQSGDTRAAIRQLPSRVADVEVIVTRSEVEALAGEHEPIRRRLEDEMRQAAAEERFEDAARYRNRLFAIERLAERQAV